MRKGSPRIRGIQSPGAIIAKIIFEVHCPSNDVTLILTYSEKIFGTEEEVDIATSIVSGSGNLKTDSPSCVTICGRIRTM